MNKWLWLVLFIIMAALSAAIWVESQKDEESREISLPVGKDNSSKMKAQGRYRRPPPRTRDRIIKPLKNRTKRVRPLRQDSASSPNHRSNPSGLLGGRQDLNRGFRDSYEDPSSGRPGALPPSVGNAPPADYRPPSADYGSVPGEYDSYPPPQPDPDYEPAAPIPDDPNTWEPPEDPDAPDPYEGMDPAFLPPERLDGDMHLPESMEGQLDEGSDFQ